MTFPRPRVDIGKYHYRSYTGFGEEEHRGADAGEEGKKCMQGEDARANA